MINWSFLGTLGGHIEVVPYRPEWPILFEQEAKRIGEACAEIIVAIEHIGSTSIPGMPAKPILDIMAGLSAYVDGLRTIEPLKRLGYEYYGENGIPGRHYHQLRDEGRVVVHLHMFEIDTENWRRHLLFRDYLRANSAAAAQYAELKRDLAIRFRNDRPAYTDAKGEFVNAIVEKARAAGK